MISMLEPSSGQDGLSLPEYQALAQLEQVQTGYVGTLERLLLTLDCSLSHPSSSYQGTSLCYDLCPLSFIAR